MIKNRNLIQAMKKAFTLVEMMIVIAIITILVTVAIPNYINFQKRIKA